jgi:hypothetical protein
MEEPWTEMGVVDTGDAALSLDALPPEVLEQVLQLAGPFATARATGVSQYLAQVAGGLAKRENESTARELCDNYDTCLYQFLLAAADDDADTVEHIIASGAIHPRRALIASVRDLPRPPRSNQEEDAYALLRTEPPSAEGWTPLTVAAAYGAPAVIARLKSLGVQPQPTVEALMSGLLRRGQRLVHAAPLIRGISALVQAYPRTSPLGPANENPLTALREYALYRSTRRALLTGDAGNFTAVFYTDVLPIALTLIEAGYRPDEHARPSVDEAHRGPSEMDLATAALDKSIEAMDAAVSRRRFNIGPIPASTIVAHWILQQLVNVYQQ